MKFIALALTLFSGVAFADATLRVWNNTPHLAYFNIFYLDPVDEYGNQIRDTYGRVITHLLQFGGEVKAGRKLESEYLKKPGKYLLSFSFPKTNTGWQLRKFEITPSDVYKDLLLAE